MDYEVPPERRSWYKRLLAKALHSYFFLTRGMTIGVRAACFNEQGELFLVRHSYVDGWHMPGGGVERGETALDALAKELKEEGNLEFGAPPVLVHVYYNRLTSKRDHVLFYRCDGVTQTGPRKPDAEIVETGFFSLEDLPEDTTYATRRRLVELMGYAPRDDVW